MDGYSFVKKGEIEGMSPSEIQNHLALPFEPDKIVDVKIPKCTEIYIGTAKKQVKGDEFEKTVDGGGVQIYSSTRIAEQNYTNKRKIKK